MLALLSVAAAVGASNFAACIGIGMSGAGPRARLRIGIVFGLFEAGMPVLGLLLGHSLAGGLGRTAHLTGAVLLALVGGYQVSQAVRGHGVPGGAEAAGQAGAAGHVSAAGQAGAAGPHLGRLLITGLALSIDNLVVGFALGTYDVSLPAAAAIIGVVSVLLSLLGLSLGERLGARAAGRGELVGGLALIAVAAALAAGVL